MATKYKRKSWVRKKAEAQAKKAWVKHRKNAQERRKVRKQDRKAKWEQRRTVASTNPDVLVSNGSFLDRHWRFSDLLDSAAVHGHSWLDKRDLRQGVLTPDEVEACLNHEGGVAEWRAGALKARREEYRAQKMRNRDSGDRAPLAMVYTASKPGELPRIQHVGFRPPAPRAPVNKGSDPQWKVSPRPPVRRRGKNHIDRVVKSWQPQMTQNARIAMAADADLSRAADSVRSFAEQFPETRTQLHDHLGKMAEFGKSYADAMDSFVQTLSRGAGEENPGLPPAVVAHLNPLKDVGEQIVRSCQETLAAWEDYFAAAIAVAKDEHTPSKAALTS